MPNILVRDISAETVVALKARARQHRRSLQQELAAVFDKAAREGVQPSPEEIATTIRARLARTGRVFTESAALVRDDRT